MSCVHFCGLKPRNDVYEIMTQSHKHRYCYVLVGGAPEANSSRPVCLCVCVSVNQSVYMSFTHVSLQQLKGEC